MTYQGKVKWFIPDKGYGFVAPEAISKDVFTRCCITPLKHFQNNPKVV